MSVIKDIYRDVKKAINFYYNRNIHIITLKKIRRYLDIDASDRSKINFIWRILQRFESEGYLVRINEKPPKQYKIAKFPIKNKIAIGDEEISSEKKDNRGFNNPK